MSVRPIREPDWLFVPPLELPLALRLENGRFFAATFPGDTATVLHVPLYEPVTADERLTIDLLRHA